jgi:hypothetical protein
MDVTKASRDGALVKIAFPLEVDEDGFPPIKVELLNATQLSQRTFRIENAPFFTPNISFGDVVGAEASGPNSQLQFTTVLDPSEFTSISVILLDPAMDTFLMDLLRGLGCVLEYGEFDVYRVLAVAVPASTDYASLRAQLTSLEADSKLSFAELAVGHRADPPNKSLERTRGR